MNQEAVVRMESGALQEYSVDDVVLQVAKIQQIMQKVMKEGEDGHYGVIPGCKKPSLFKAGAEKLGFTFRLAPKFFGEDSPRDLGHGNREYIIRCELYHVPSGAFVGSGVGSCSTLEVKYRYRTGPQESTGKSVPNEYWNLRKTDPERAQNLLGGKGFIAHKNDSGKWEIFVRGQRMENPDPADNYNTVLKMAKKRAHVDAILTATAASDIFTQDVEDMDLNGKGDDAAVAKTHPIGQTVSEEPPVNDDMPPADDMPPEMPTAAKPVITDPQRKRMYAIARNAGMNDEQFKHELERMGFKSSKDVTKESYDDVCSFFQQWKP